MHEIDTEYLNVDYWTLRHPLAIRIYIVKIANSYGTSGCPFYLYKESSTQIHKTYAKKFLPLKIGKKQKIVFVRRIDNIKKCTI